MTTSTLEEVHLERFIPRISNSLFRPTGPYFFFVFFDSELETSFLEIPDFARNFKSSQPRFSFFTAQCQGANRPFR
jgi:hypothetical protein